MLHRFDFPRMQNLGLLHGANVTGGQCQQGHGMTLRRDKFNLKVLAVLITMYDSADITAQ
ncbi:MAG: hypothetical protein WD894_08825 [Pirellulales bacterium]